MLVAVYVEYYDYENAWDNGTPSQGFDWAIADTKDKAFDIIESDGVELCHVFYETWGEFETEEDAMRFVSIEERG